MISFVRNTAVFCALAAFIPTMCGCTETSEGSFSSAKAESVSDSPGSACIGEFLYSRSDGYFDYEQICRKYAGDEAGVKHDGFVNTDDRLIHNGSEAFNRAKNELDEGFSYNLVDADYDSNNDMWAVTFSTNDMLGDCITVYLDAYGRTVLMVSGE